MCHPRESNSKPDALSARSSHSTRWHGSDDWALPGCRTHGVIDTSAPFKVEGPGYNEKELQRGGCGCWAFAATERQRSRVRDDSVQDCAGRQSVGLSEEAKRQSIGLSEEAKKQGIGLGEEATTQTIGLGTDAKKQSIGWSNDA